MTKIHLTRILVERAVFCANSEAVSATVCFNPCDNHFRHAEPNPTKVPSERYLDVWNLYRWKQWLTKTQKQNNYQTYPQVPKWCNANTYWTKRRKEDKMKISAADVKYKNAWETLLEIQKKHSRHVELHVITHSTLLGVAAKRTRPMMRDAHCKIPLWCVKPSTRRSQSSSARPRSRCPLHEAHCEEN